MEILGFFVGGLVCGGIIGIVTGMLLERKKWTIKMMEQEPMPDFFAPPHDPMIDV